MSRTYAILALLAAILFVGASSAQSDSHIELQFDRIGGRGALPGGEMAKQLQDRLGERGQVPKGLEPETARQLLDLAQKFKDNPDAMKKAVEKNPELADSVRKWLQNNPDAQQQLLDQAKKGNPSGNAESFKSIQEMLKNIKPTMPDGSGSTIPFPNSTPGGNSASNGGPGAGVATPPDIANPQRPSTNPFDPSKLGRPPMPNLPQRTGADAQASDFFQRMERWFPQDLKDSPSLKRFFNDAAKTDWSKVGGTKLWKDGEGPSINWNRVGRNLNGTGKFLDRNLPNVSRRNLPNAPRINAPTLPSAPNLPNLGAPSGGIDGAGSAFTTIAIIGALGLGAFLLWKLLIRPMQLAKRQKSDDGLGAWPVDPAQIRTREELVKAVDYLALKSCGPPAKVWHHRQVANELGVANDNRRRAADSLAGAYMQARYSPPAEPFDELTLQRARHDLSSLAERAGS